MHFYMQNVWNQRKSLMPLWWNWQTRYLEVVVPKRRRGSNPLKGTILLAFMWNLSYRPSSLPKDHEIHFLLPVCIVFVFALRLFFRPALRSQTKNAESVFGSGHTLVEKASVEVRILRSFH